MKTILILTAEPCDMAKHSEKTRNRIVELWRGGMNQDQIARSMRGLIDRTTIQAWIKACRESDKGQ